MGFWSGITDYVNNGFESVKDCFSSVKDSISSVEDSISSVKDSISDVSSYVSDAFKDVYHPHDKTDDNEYKITPIEDKNYEYDLWIRTVGFDILPDYEDYFKHY